MLHVHDVIDVQLIGHSRGTSVVGQAMQELLDNLSSQPLALQEGYFELTLLDPHPANIDTVKDVSISNAVPGFDLGVMDGYALPRGCL